MAVGTSQGLAGQAVSTSGESEIIQLTAANDILTIRGVASQTGDFVVLRNSALTERLAVEAAGQVVGTVAPTGSSADNAVEFTVTDATTGSSGYARGIYCNYTASGTKTSSAEVNVLAADLTVSGNTPYAYVASLYFATSGNPTIGLAAIISYYQDAVGSGMSQWIGFDQQIAAGASPGGGIYSYQRFRNHAGSNAPTSMFYIQSNNNSVAATYFIDQAATTTGPAIDDTSNVPAAATHKVRCRHGADDFYLVGVADF